MAINNEQKTKFETYGTVLLELIKKQKQGKFEGKIKKIEDDSIVYIIYLKKRVFFTNNDENVVLLRWNGNGKQTYEDNVDYRKIVKESISEANKELKMNFISTN